MSDLPAGRELDALVAEKVMGLGVQSRDEAIARSKELEPEWGPWETWYSRDMYLTVAFPHVGFTQLPHYSTDIAAAWEVVEKVFHAKGWSLWPLSDAKQIEDDSPEWWATGWGVYTSSGIDLWDDEIAIAETAPLAICRAALKAVGT